MCVSQDEMRAAMRNELIFGTFTKKGNKVPTEAPYASDNQVSFDTK